MTTRFKNINANVKGTFFNLKVPRCIAHEYVPFVGAITSFLSNDPCIRTLYRANIEIHLFLDRRFEQLAIFITHYFISVATNTELTIFKIDILLMYT